MHILVKYLEFTNLPGFVEFLIQMLKIETMSNLDLYLPQLCYLVVTKQHKECLFKLRKFIVEISIENSNIGLRALHYFQSWSEDDIQTCMYVQAARDFFDLLEQALVNQTPPKQFQSQQPKLLEMNEYLDK